MTTEWNPDTGMVEAAPTVPAEGTELDDALNELVRLMTKAGPFGSPRDRAANLLRHIADETPAASAVGGIPSAVGIYLDTLRRARVQLHRDLADGSTCPCCGQYAKAYRRKLNSGMASALIRVYREHGTDWAHVPELASVHGGDYAKLRHWGLVEESFNLRADGGRAGTWRITSLGSSFVRGTVSVASHVVIYNNQLLHVDDTTLVTVRDALGSRFSYDELMGR